MADVEKEKVEGKAPDDLPPAELVQALVDSQGVSDDPIELGPRVITADEITEKLVEGATRRAEAWKKRLLRPRKHPIKEGIAAEGKWKSRMEEAIREERRKKALEKVSDEDYIKAVEATDPSDFARGVERKKEKIKRRFEVLQPLYERAARYLDQMPVDTDAQREKKLLAARKLMQLVGQVRKGVITVEEFDRKAREICGLS